MKITYYLFIITLFTISILSCKGDLNSEISDRNENLSQSKKQEDPLRGLTFRYISEIPQFKDYVQQAGSVIDNSKIGTDYKYGVAWYGDGKNNLIVLEEFIRERNNPEVKYKILHTITIDELKEDEYLTLCTCRINSVSDSEIIAIVKADHDKEYFDRVIKAWRTDTESKKIIPIKNLKNIDCVNEGYGLEGCGEDEALEPEENFIEKDSLE